MFDESGITRRQVLQAGGTFVGYALAADTVLAQAIKTDAAGLVAGDAEVKIGNYAMPVYEARPASGTGHPIVVCISEIWGVHEYIKDTARRFAKEGYCAIAPELFKREGGLGHMTNIPDILKIVLNQPREQTLGDIDAAIEWAQKLPGVRADRVGVTGWCWGGGVTIQVAGTNPNVKAAVTWYGPPARPMKTAAGGQVTGFDVAKDVKIPWLGLFGEEDKSPSPADVRKFEELLKQHNRNVEVVIYPKAGHAFHADYRPSYRAEAAADGWKRCLAWFGKNLKA